MSLTEKASVLIQILTLIIAAYIGVLQNNINARQVSLSDFVAIAASPDASGQKITLLNTGKSNLYMSKIEIGGETYSYARPRLLATGTLESSYYWVNPPASLPLDKDFELKIYVTDEFGTTWLSEHAGQVHENATKNRVLNMWSYRTEKKAW